MSQEKEFYKNTMFPKGLYPINHALADFILSMKPKSVFEFGCHDGRNLALMNSKNPNPQYSGLDINPHAIANGLRDFPFLFLKCGDETRLFDFAYLDEVTYDVVFTNSVLCHIPNKMTQIIENLKDLARIGVLLVETQEIKNQYYFAHDYAAHGFKKINTMQSVGQPLGNGALYDFWWYQK